MMSLSFCWHVHSSTSTLGRSRARGGGTGSVELQRQPVQKQAVSAQLTDAVLQAGLRDLDMQHSHLRPAQPQLGALLVQQPLQPCSQQVGLLLLQQPVPPTQLWPPARSASKVQLQQPQLCHRASQPLHAQGLAAADGYLVSRRERYMAPEAAVLQGHVLPVHTPQDTTVMATAQATAAAAAVAATDATAVAPAHALVSLQAANNTYSSQKLVVAAQSCVIEVPKELVQPASAAHTVHTPQQQLRRRRRTSTSSSSNTSSDSRGGNSNASSSSSGNRRSRSRTSSNSHNDKSLSGSSTCADVAHMSSSPAADQQHKPASSNGACTHSSTSATGSQASDVSQRLHAAAGPDEEGEAEEQQQLLLQQLAAGLQEQHGIELDELRFGTQRPMCPQCGGGSSGEDCFSVTLGQQGTALFNCHRATCGFSGGWTLPRSNKKSSSSSSIDAGGSCSSSSSSGGGSSSSSSSSSCRHIHGTQAHSAPLPAALQAQLQPLSPQLQSWLVDRGIAPAVLCRNRVSMQRRFIHGLQREVECIAFPYYQAGQLVNVKYRALPKHFTQTQGGQQVLYGLDDLKGWSWAIIVEGELDKLAIEAATGYTAVVSLPSGAVPAPRAGQQQAYTASSKKLACVDRAAGQLSQLRQCLIAVDGDAPGWATAQALANKLRAYLPPGAEISNLAWPSAAVGGQNTLRRVAQAAAAQGVSVDLAAAARCKDANDVLMVCGPQVLQLYLTAGPTLWGTV